mgnify:CR=1 FL=1
MTGLFKRIMLTVVLVISLIGWLNYLDAGVFNTGEHQQPDNKEAGASWVCLVPNCTTSGIPVCHEICWISTTGEEIK